MPRVALKMLDFRMSLWWNLNVRSNGILVSILLFFSLKKAGVSLREPRMYHPSKPMKAPHRKGTRQVQCGFPGSDIKRADRLPIIMPIAAAHPVKLAAR